MITRRRRGMILLAVAGAGVVVTFLSVLSYTQEVASRLGPTQTVVTTSRDIPPWTPITTEDVSVLSVPVRFAPAGALGSTGDVVGQVSPMRMPTGTFVLTSSIVDPPRLAPDEREVTLQADGEVSFGGTIAVDDVVDITAVYSDSGFEPVVLIPGRVLAVHAATAERGDTLVSLAVQPDGVTEIARARAAADAIIVARQAPSEVRR